MKRDGGLIHRLFFLINFNYRVEFPTKSGIIIKNKLRRIGMKNFFKKVPVNTFLKADSRLTRHLNARDLVALGIGAVIGTGVFVSGNCFWYGWNGIC